METDLVQETQVRGQGKFISTSIFIDNLYDAVIQELRSYFPIEHTKPFTIFKYSELPNPGQPVEVYGNNEIMEIMQIYGMTETADNEPLLIQWHKTLRKMQNHPQVSRNEGTQGR